MADLRRAVSFAFRAASRATCADTLLSKIARATVGFSSK